MKSFPFNYIYAFVHKHMCMPQHIRQGQSTTKKQVLYFYFVGPSDKAWVIRLGGRSFLGEPSQAAHVRRMVGVQG